MRSTTSNILQIWNTDRAVLRKIGVYAIVQRTMPKTARSIFRSLMRLHLGILSFASHFHQTGSATIEQGRMYLHQGKIEEASSEFRTLLKKHPINEEAAMWLTRTLLIQGNYLEAQRILFRAIAWHSASIPLRRQLAGLLFSTGSYWEAEAEYQKLLKQFHTESLDVLFGLAALAFGDARYDDAFEWYKRALNVDPKNLVASLGIVECSRYIEQPQAFGSELDQSHITQAALRRNQLEKSEPIVESSKSSKSKDLAVLIIDHYLPSIGSSAGSIHLYEIIKLFCDAGVHVTVIGRNGEYQKRSKMQLESMGVETYATDPERLVAWNYKSGSEEIDFSRLLKKHRYVLAFLTRYNIADVYMDVLRKLSPDLPIAIDSEDVHYVREERKESLYGSHSGASSLRSKELEIYSRADCLIAVSDPDAEVLKKQFPRKKVSTLPLIYPINRSVVPFSERKDLLFVGNFVHPPNSDAVVHFHGRILPLLRNILPDVKTYIVGSNSIPLLEGFASDDLILTGYVPSMQPFLDSCRINIAPLRYGAGMNGKVLESMAAGLPVVTTPIVAAGIANHGGMLIAEDPEEFVHAIVRLYNDEQLWNSIRDQAYELVKSRFTPQVIAEQIDELLAWAAGQQSDL